MSLLYLIASLPMLHADAAAGITPAKFVEACREQLGARDAAAAEALLHGQPADHPFVTGWLDKEAILRNAVARERARLAGQEPARWLRPASGCDCQIESEVEDAFLEADPLARERELDKIRWRIADELQGPDPLTAAAVFAYALKLAIVTRWSGLNEARGRHTFDDLTRVPLTL